MPISTTAITSRADKIVGAWKKSAAAKSFGDLTVDQYEALRTAVADASATVVAAEAATTEARNTLASALDTLNTASNDVVDGVRGDKSVGGADGSLYEAMGYVRKSERSSGLTRKKTSVATAAAPSA
jgi:hypothetical protein